MDRTGSRSTSSTLPKTRRPVSPGSSDRTIALFFLGGTARCEIGTGASSYAYGVLLDRGQEPAWDFAPDDAWLRIR